MDAGTIFLQLLLSGILIGGVYSLVAMGFVITYRSAQVFNIAYGQFAVVGFGEAGAGVQDQVALQRHLALGDLFVDFVEHVLQLFEIEHRPLRKVQIAAGMLDVLADPP